MTTTPRAGLLHEYYRDAGRSPTFGALKSEADLDGFSRRRAELFGQKLHLPVRLFRGARVLEFGPDTGENALAFGRWGARLELVEPNQASWPQIRAYFEHFGMANSLVGLRGETLQDFAPVEPADIVIAEGFIHTVKPEAMWIDVVRRALAPGGFVVLFYYERTAQLMELFHAASFAEFCRLSGMSGVAAARRIFGAKWDSIPHVRAFESWVMDVLENPYTRTAFTLDAPALVNDMAAAGLDFYQSWPRYRDELRIKWHKTPEPKDGVVAEVASHLPRMALGHALGQPLLVVGSGETVRRCRETLDDLLGLVDGAIGQGGAAVWAHIGDALAALQQTIGAPADVFAADPGVRDRASATLAGLVTCARVLAAGQVDDIVRFMSGDPTFLSTWGQPAHFCVFQKAPTESAAGPSD